MRATPQRAHLHAAEIGAGHYGHGAITLRTGSAPESVWIDISDTGMGMSAEMQKRIFEPLYTNKPVGKGTGLGLSISWDIVKRHGGNLEVQSNPRQGTRFRITLPTVPLIAPAEPATFSTNH